MPSDNIEEQSYTDKNLGTIENLPICQITKKIFKMSFIKYTENVEINLVGKKR